MATLTNPNDYFDPDIVTQVSERGPEEPDRDNRYLSKDAVKYKFLYRSHGITDETTLKTPIDDMVKHVLVLYVSHLVCVSMIREIPAVLQGNVNPAYEKWNQKCKKYLEDMERHEALLNKNDFLTDEAIEEEDLDEFDNSGRFECVRES